MSSIIDTKVEFKKEGFEKLIKIMKDLAKISTKDAEGKSKSIVKYTFEGDKIHIYSTGGADSNRPNAFKSYIVNFDEIFESVEGEIDKTHMIILDGKKLTKIMELYLKSDKPIKGKLTSQKKGNYIHTVYLQISSGRTRDNLACGEINTIKNLSINDVETVLEPSRRNFSFSFNQQHLIDAKKRVSITGPIYEFVAFDLFQGDLYLKQEDKWQIYLGDLQAQDGTFRFNKQYLTCIDMQEQINVNIYDTFLTIESGESYLMVSFEVSDF